MTLGDLLSARSAYNTALESGNWAALANMFSNTGMGLMNLGYGQLGAKTMQPDSPDAFDYFMQGYGPLLTGIMLAA